VIVQDDRFKGTSSITICAFTSDPTDAPLFRLAVEPSEANGLDTVSRLMVDKVTTVPKAKLGKRIGRLADSDMVRVNRALMILLGLAG
jgi:mRNA interferase MazF